VKQIPTTFLVIYVEIYKTSEEMPVSCACCNAKINFFSETSLKEKDNYYYKSIIRAVRTRNYALRPSCLRILTFLERISPLKINLDAILQYLDVLISGKQKKKKKMSRLYDVSGRIAWFLLWWGGHRSRRPKYRNDDVILSIYDKNSIRVVREIYTTSRSLRNEFEFNTK